MAGGDLREFDVKPKDLQGSAEQVAVMIQTELMTFIRDYVPKLSKEQALILLDALPRELTTTEAAGPKYDASFSIGDEIGLQLQAVQALRQHLFPDGRMRHDTSVREAKDVLATCNQMIKTLRDSHREIMNMERMRAVETATIEVLSDMSDADKERFLHLLAVKLEGVS